MKTKKRNFIFTCLLSLCLVLAGCGSLSQKKGGSITILDDGTGAGSVSSNDPSQEETAAKDPEKKPRDLTGRKLSIMGDSISTFDGYIPTDYNIFYPGSGEISTVEKTWWFQVYQATGMLLHANASSSNTTITGNSADTTGSAPGCSTKRMLDLTPGDNGAPPDILFVFMGTNDFLRSVELGSFSGASARTEGEITNFCEAYELMIQKLNALYPDTEIYFFTLLETSAGDVDDNPDAYPATNKNGNTIGDFNAEIATIASAYGYPVIDVHNCGITYETLGEDTSDGVHPNAAGAKKIADYVTHSLLYDF